MQKLKVDLGDRSYSIRIGNGLSGEIIATRNAALEAGKKVAFFFDTGFRSAHSLFCEKLSSGHPCMDLPSGEKTKSVVHLEQVWDFLARIKMDRGCVVFAVGGGVIGDLIGFAAGSFLRGIDFYQVPTTLLAMVDSSVGGKTGINLTAGKNLVGAFHQPSEVLADTEFLKLLPPREFSSGMAEVIKYGMLADKDLYQKISGLSKPLEHGSEELVSIIKECCTIKASIVKDDEKETSLNGKGRALLNLGHTFAHAFEAVAGYGTYLHGEAVAIGLVCALKLSKKMGLCPNDSEIELCDLLRSYNLPLSLRAPLCLESLLEAMKSDKKVSLGKPRFVIMKQIGDAFQTDDIDQDLVSEVLEEVGATTTG